MIRDVNLLGTSIAGSIVYLCLITFLRMLLWSHRILGSGIFFISLTLLLQNLSCCCYFFSTSKLSFLTLQVSFFGEESAKWTSSIMFSTTSSIVDGSSSLSLFLYRPSVLSLEMASATTFHLPWICWNLMLNCCSSRAHLSSTGLDMPVVKNGASGL